MMPESMHESAEIHSKTIEHLKELKQINKNCFWGVVGRRVGFRASKWSQMDQHGPTWSEKDTKREPKATKMEPKAPTVRQKATNKNKKNDVRKRSVQGAFPDEGGQRQINILRENVGRKVPFWKARKSKMAPKSNFSVKIGTGTL
jgi:hypothetical protein